MTRTALILGSTGRFGRNMADALARHGWTVRRFNRSTDDLTTSAQGAELIVNAWNMPYAKWAEQMPGLTARVIAAAKASGAAVMIPGNVYVYGQDLPTVLSPDTPHRATNPLGRIRRDMEDAYRASGVKTVILRAGDYIDTQASGNWFDMIVAAKVAKGRISYPGPLDRPHAFAFLPDLAEAGAALAEQLDALDRVTEAPFDGFTLTGTELAAALTRALGKPVRAKQMSWLPIQIARPFWAEAKHLLEMRYLWNRPHRVDGTALQNLVPAASKTPLDDALRQACSALL